MKIFWDVSLNVKGWKLWLGTIISAISIVGRIVVSSITRAATMIFFVFFIFTIITTAFTIIVVFIPNLVVTEFYFWDNAFIYWCLCLRIGWLIFSYLNIFQNRVKCFTEIVAEGNGRLGRFVNCSLWVRKVRKARQL